MGGFNTLFLNPADAPAPWKIVLKKRRGRSEYRTLIYDANDLFVAEASSKGAADAIIWAVNHLAAAEAAEGGTVYTPCTNALAVKGDS